MATNFLAVHEKIWFDQFKYDDTERKFHEQINGLMAQAPEPPVGLAEITVSCSL
jgi:cytochrome c556